MATSFYLVIKPHDESPILTSGQILVKDNSTGKYNLYESETKFKVGSGFNRTLELDSDEIEDLITNEHIKEHSFAKSATTPAELVKYGSGNRGGRRRRTHRRKSRKHRKHARKSRKHHY
jgi:hypothetical protein